MALFKSQQVNFSSWRHDVVLFNIFLPTWAPCSLGFGQSRDVYFTCPINTFFSLQELKSDLVYTHKIDFWDFTNFSKVWYTPRHMLCQLLLFKSEQTITLFLAFLCLRYVQETVKLACSARSVTTHIHSSSNNNISLEIYSSSEFLTDSELQTIMWDSWISHGCDCQDYTLPESDSVYFDIRMMSTEQEVTPAHAQSFWVPTSRCSPSWNHSQGALAHHSLLEMLDVFSLSSRAACRSCQWQSRIPIPLYGHQYPAPLQTRLYPTGIIAWSVDCTKILKKLGVSIFKDDETPQVGSSKFIRERCTFYQTTRRRIAQQS